MEHLIFELPSKHVVSQVREQICGVVGSGNLEVLVSNYHDGPGCLFDITTSANGFGHIWQAVLHNFSQNHPVGGLKFAINDMGATPAVVNLRLSQVLALIQEE